MKKRTLFSIVGLLLLLLASYGFSGSQSGNDDFVPVEKGKTYQIFTSNGQKAEITILEEPKENWVKADIKREGIHYLNLDHVLAISTK